MPAQEITSPLPRRPSTTRPRRRPAQVTHSPPMESASTIRPVVFPEAKSPRATSRDAQAAPAARCAPTPAARECSAPDDEQFAGFLRRPSQPRSALRPPRVEKLTGDTISFRTGDSIRTLFLTAVNQARKAAHVDHSEFEVCEARGPWHDRAKNPSLRHTGIQTPPPPEIASASVLRVGN